METSKPETKKNKQSWLNVRINEPEQSEIKAIADKYMGGNVSKLTLDTIFEKETLIDAFNQVYGVFKDFMPLIKGEFAKAKASGNQELMDFIKSFLGIVKENIKKPESPEEKGSIDIITEKYKGDD
jgi:hypothetical protein